ncbi:hypothetical protein K3N28_20510 [Glycomyces sp. TRM65418]|uniref:hypothetical protein n=1 Tax=Glycomyces sp. TRM65418 TaxID=2867006 RepID=UPI001CE6FEB3|nr:hypothetical protein [Glycomyces sp. TRM65418]MCC3765448.1 hypothetical protein [Glycomyces sp. TRM65418]QZD55058.1 hypothetical protein K3N28_20410 [Glycomyces sp. TRM65418]
MRHHRVVARREHRRAFRRAFSTAAAATALAAALGYAVAFSPLAGWAALGVAGAVTVTVWAESRSGRAAASPITRLSLFDRSGDD